MSIKKYFKKIDLLWFFYLIFSKSIIGYILIFLSILDVLSLWIFGISFYETTFMFIRSNQNNFYIFIFLFMAFLSIFAIIFYILSKKYDLRLHNIFEKKTYRFLIFPIIIFSLFVVFILFVFVIILVNFLEDFIFQRIFFIFGNSLISLILGIAWFIFIRYFWKHPLYEE